jgi:trimethylamine corrinoid protein
MTEFKALCEQFEQALLSLNRVAARELYEEARQTHSALELAELLIGATLSRIGESWDEGRVALSQVYMSGRVCEELVGSITAVGENGRFHPTTAIAVLEDHHALGKRIIHSALASSGFKILDYGFGVSVDRLVERVRQDQVEILLISTLMLRSALRVEEVAKRLPDTTIIVGGAPFLFDDQLWKNVGASAMGRNAADAIALVTQLTEEPL